MVPKLTDIDVPNVEGPPGSVKLRINILILVHKRTSYSSYPLTEREPPQIHQSLSSGVSYNRRIHKTQLRRLGGPSSVLNWTGDDLLFKYDL